LINNIEIKKTNILKFLRYKKKKDI
ncbi:hypothetical protein LCGC14_3127110, partial [marine sediment metagenome]